MFRLLPHGSYAGQVDWRPFPGERRAQSHVLGAGASEEGAAGRSVVKSLCRRIVVMPQAHGAPTLTTPGSWVVRPACSHSERPKVLGNCGRGWMHGTAVRSTGRFASRCLRLYAVGERF